MRFKKLLITLLTFVTVSLLFTNTTYAKESDGYDYVLTPRVVLKDRINIRDPINSDAYLVAYDVSINSPINGDLFVVAQNVEINAEINGDVRFIANSVKINSRIIGSVSGAVSDLNITSLGEVDKDVYGFIDKINHRGRIGGNLNISPQEDSEANIQGKVIGSIYYTGERPIIIPEAFINGLYSIPNVLSSTNESKDAALLILLKGFSLMIIYAIFRILLSKYFESFTESAKSPFLDTIKRGIITLSILIIIILCLFITFIGIPGAIILFGFLVLCFYLSPLFGSICLSKRLFSENYQSFVKFSISLFLLLIVFQAPYIGFAIQFLTILWTIGIVSKAISSKQKSE